MHLPISSSLSFLVPFTSLAAAASIPLSARDVLEAPDTAAPSALPHITSLSYSGDGCPSSSPGVERTGAGFSDIGFRLNGFAASLPSIETSTTACQVHLQATGCAPGWQVGIQSATIKGHLVLDPSASVTWYLTSFWSENAAVTVRESTARKCTPCPSPLLLVLPFSILILGNPTLRPSSLVAIRVDEQDKTRQEDMKIGTYIINKYLQNLQSTISGTISNTGSSRFDEDVTRSAGAGAVVWSSCTKGDGYLGTLNVNFRVALDAPGKQYGYFGKDAGTATTETWNYVWRQC